MGADVDVRRAVGAHIARGEGGGAIADVTERVRDAGKLLCEAATVISVAAASSGVVGGKAGGVVPRASIASIWAKAT